MRPGQFQDRLVFLWVESITRRIYVWWYRSEQIDRKLGLVWRRYHLNDDWIDGVCDDTARSGDILHNFLKRVPLYFFSLQVRQGILEVKDDVTLLQLFDKQVGPFSRDNVLKTGQPFQFYFLSHMESGGALSLWSFVYGDGVFLGILDSSNIIF